jgi:hypothetical protein
VDGIDMPEVKGMNMLEEHERSLNQRSEVEVMGMVGICMVGVECMDMVEEHLSKQQPVVEDMDMVEDTMAEVDVEAIEKEHEGVVLVKH